jgi:Fe-S-cluster containining protein
MNSLKVTPIFKLNANEDKDTCSKCGGECCKGMPGLYHPDDLFDGMSDVEIKEKIISMLMQGNVVITYNDLNKTRISSLAAKASLARNNWFIWDNYGCCVNLSDAGCRLSATDRPRECRELTPAANMKCKPAPSFDRENLLEEWSIYEDIFEQVNDFFFEKNISK